MSESNFKPDFIGIGAAKAGSTWVSECIKSHPEICLSVPKEINYFNSHGNFLYGNFYGREKNINFDKDISWYAGHFSHCKPGNKKGEFSTSYIYDEKAPQKIKETFNDVKIIAVLRNPAERSFSQYLMLKNYLKKEERDFAEVVKEEPEYIKRSMYYEQLSRYLEFFSMDQMLIITLDEIHSDPKDILKRLYGFIGVDTEFIPEKIFNKKSNQSKKVRLGIITKIIYFCVRTISRLRLNKLLTLAEKLKIDKVINKINTKKVDKESIDPEIRRYMNKQFLPDIEKLEKLINKDLSNWK